MVPLVAYRDLFLLDESTELLMRRTLSYLSVCGRCRGHSSFPTSHPGFAFARAAPSRPLALFQVRCAWPRQQKNEEYKLGQKFEKHRGRRRGSVGLLAYFVF
jgi:hypothetical protein